MSLAKALWEAHTHLVRAALEHPFVRGLADGTAPRPHFQRYIAQDAFFLDAFARAYALALARSPDQDGPRAFFALLAGALEELALHGPWSWSWSSSRLLPRVRRKSTRPVLYWYVPHGTRDT